MLITVGKRLYMVGAAALGYGLGTNSILLIVSGLVAMSVSYYTIYKSEDDTVSV